MADNKKKVKQDRKLVAETQPYEASYFKRKFDLTMEQAKKIIARYGPSRDKANAAAKKLKRK